MTTDTIIEPTAAISAEVLRASAQPQKRAMVALRDSIDREARTVELAFASEVPYVRWWGIEVLECRAETVDLSRLNSRHPLLLDHDPSHQIGVVERAWVGDDRKARALVRFSRSARAEEIWQDVLDGIRELVSVGYRIDDMVLAGKEGDTETYRVTRWTPHEVSIVSVPADPTVGIGRSLAAEAPNAHPQEKPTVSETTAAPAAQTPDIRVIETEAARRAHERVNEILAIGQAHQMEAEARAAIADPKVDVAEFRRQVLDKLKERGAVREAPATPAIGLSTRELKQFSITRLMLALLEPNDREAQRAAGLEIEASVAARKLRPVDEMGKLGNHRAAGYTVPWDVLADGQMRDLGVGTASQAGNLVATNLLAGSFIDMLRNRIVLAGLGARMLDGLVGNLAIPKQTGGATSYWVTEGNAPTESQLTTGQVTLAPKTVGAFTDFTRKALLQSTPSIEALVRADLAASLAVAIDTAGINGSGSGGEPTGIIGTAGIGAVAGGTNGAAPTYAHMIALEEQIAIDNADVANMAFLTNAKMRAQLRGTQEFSSTNGVSVWRDNNTVLGYNAVVTNSVPSTLTKGSASSVCSAIVLGNWADMLIGMWGGLDLVLDPYALATSGGRRVIALQDVDIAVRRAESFAAMLDALRT